MTEPFYLSERFDLNWSQPGQASPALDVQLALSRFAEAAKVGASSPGEQPSVIYPQIHVLSADKVTRNRTMYTTAAHKGSRAAHTGQHGFTRPYPVPIIKDHLSAPECGSPASTIFGRFIDAKLVKQADTGQGHVAGLAEVTHPEGVDEMLSGRWLTGSLGSSVNHVHCSVCGQPFGGPNDVDTHPHRKGRAYKMRKGVKPGTPEAEADDAWDAADPGDRGAQLCYHVIDTPMGYQPREYSGVVVPSDDSSIVNVADTNTMPGSHFTPDGAPRQGAEGESPRSALWVPMTASSRAGLSSYGERYIDLVSGAESRADRLGLLSGRALDLHLERVLSGEDAILEESASLAESALVFAFPGLTSDAEEIVPETETETLPAPEPEPSPEAPAAPESVVGPARDRAHYLAGLRELSRTAAPRDRTAREAALRRQALSCGWASRSPKETVLTDLSPGFALRLSYTSAREEEFTLDWLPRADEAQRLASLALFEESEIASHLSADEALVVRARLAPDADAAAESVLVPITESNYPLFILVSQYGLPGEGSASAESFEDDARNESPLCDGGPSRKETLRHAREAFRTIESLPGLLESLAERLAALEGAPALETAPDPVAEEADPEAEPVVGEETESTEDPSEPPVTESDTLPSTRITSPLDESGESEVPPVPGAVAPGSPASSPDEPGLPSELAAQLRGWRGLGVRRSFHGR